MTYHCYQCGRFIRRVRGVAMPVSTAFPPDTPNTAHSIPYAPFNCYNHGRWGKVEFKPVNWRMT